MYSLSETLVKNASLNNTVGVKLCLQLGVAKLRPDVVQYCMRYSIGYNNLEMFVLLSNEVPVLASEYDYMVELNRIGIMGYVTSKKYPIPKNVSGITSIKLKRFVTDCLTSLLG